MRRKIRSGVLALVLPVFLSVFSGCTDLVRPELDETHAKLQALQELAGAVNWDLHILDLIVRELDDSHTILPESFHQTEDGYEVSFRDGKKIVIPFGKDGADGRQFIPVGVKDEDGVYYWQLDGEWMKDADGNRIRAGATDGFVPQFKVEDGSWWISFDGGASFSELASCDEMDGFGVFRDVRQTTSGKVVLTLWDGETIELRSQFPFRMSFEGPVRDTLLIAAGELLPVPYKVVVEGETDQPVVVTSGTDGVYLSSLEAADATSGVVKVQAPADYADGYILLSAGCGGYSALKMITFRPREITPAESFATVRLGSGSDPKAVPFKANFPYVVTVKTQQGEAWLEAVSDPETGTLTFTPQANAGSEVRECVVTISPEDNPDYVCTTFRVVQATETPTVQLEEGSPFTFDPESKTLYAPAQGGDAVLWLTFPSSLTAVVSDDTPWIRAEVVDVDGFRRLGIHVDPTEDTAVRGGSVLVCLQARPVPVDVIKVIQSGAVSGD